QDLAGPQLRSQRVGDVDQEAITGVVPERVVDLLEAVEIAPQQRAVAAAVLRARHLAIELLLEAAAVEEVGERVAAREVAQARLEVLALGDVEADADGAGDGPVAVAQRLDVELIDP